MDTYDISSCTIASNVCFVITMAKNLTREHMSIMRVGFAFRGRGRVLQILTQSLPRVAPDSDLFESFLLTMNTPLV